MTETRPPGKPPMCSGTGKPVAVTKDGRRVCGDCGVEIEDIVVRLPAKSPKR